MEVLAILAGVTTAIVLFKFLFSDMEDFVDCLKFWLMPDIFSFFRGQYWDDQWAELKLFVWLGASVAVGYGVYVL